MARIVLILIALVIVSCTASASPATQSPYALAPTTGTEFITSDIDLQWEWASLAEHQHYVVRLWYEDEAPTEVWTETTQINAAGLIDHFEKQVGTFHWHVAVVNTDENGGFVEMVSEWSDQHSLERVRQLSLVPVPEEDRSDTANYIASQNLPDTNAIIDFTQNWMYENTLVGDDLTIYEPDYSDAADMMFAHFQEGTPAPQMFCDGLSTTMLTVLRELGIESHTIYLYGQAPGWISQHTMLEVFNPDTQRWQVQDPAFNAHYIDADTGERLSIEQMVFESLDDIMGCQNGVCGSDNATHINGYLGAFRIGFSSEVWVNPDRFDVTSRIEALDNANFPEFIASISGVSSRDISLRFDNWEITSLEN